MLKILNNLKKIPKKINKKNIFIILSIIIIITMLIIPVPYIIETPGPTFNTLNNKVLKIKNYEQKTEGQLRFLTVSTYGIENDLPLFFAVYEYFNKNSRVLPAEAILDKKISYGDQEKVFKKQMTESQSSAILSAKKYLKINKMPKISIDSQNAGGPSAGLMFTLSIISKMKKKSLTGNTIVAGTGTINKNGKVSEIGGIRQKIISAKKDGAKFFLSPYNNCQELDSWTPNGIKTFSVKTLSDAIFILNKIKNKRTNELSNYFCSN